MENGLIIVPARKGSKEVVRKNIRPLKGKPLVAHTFEQVIQLNPGLDYFISTDDTEVVRIAEEMGLNVDALRPADLASDQAPMIDVVRHAIQTRESTMAGTTYDFVVLLQPTAPLRSVSDIQKCIALLQTSGTDSVISVQRVTDKHPNLMKRINDGVLVPFGEPEIEGTRRQDYRPKAYMRNGAIYVCKRDVVINEHSLWGNSITPYEMPTDRSVSVDSIIDFHLIELLMSENE